MLDLKRYYRLQPKGLCWVERDEENFVLKFKRFDIESGEELSPEPQYAKLEELEKDRLELSTQLEAIDSIINKIKYNNDKG